VAKVQFEDFHRAGDQWVLLFHKKRAEVREIPVAQDLKRYLDEYLKISDLRRERRRRDPKTGEWSPCELFRTAVRNEKRLTKTAITGLDIDWMMQRHLKRAGLLKEARRMNQVKNLAAFSILEHHRARGRVRTSGFSGGHIDAHKNFL